MGEKDYSDDCKHRDSQEHIACKLFDMSCAMFHTRIWGLDSCAGKGRCPYYAKKVVGK